MKLGPGSLQHMLTTYSFLNLLLAALLIQCIKVLEGRLSSLRELSIWVDRHRKICYMNRCFPKECPQPAWTSKIFPQSCAEVRISN